MNVLSDILSKKRERVSAARAVTSLEQLREQANQATNQHTLRKVLQSDTINIIAEYKRRSPSKGMIRGDVTPAQIAQSYEAGGAVAMSVLTEEDYFSGSLDDLRAVKATVKLPVLRKDFVFDDYQIYESSAAGADGILLIVGALEDEQLQRLRQLAEDELGLDALVEVHTSDEMKRAAASGATLIGVNNRDLRTFEVSLQTSLSLASQAPSNALLVSESGLHSADDLNRLHAAGYRGFLIGETLMRAADPATALRNLRSATNSL